MQILLNAATTTGAGPAWQERDTIPKYTYGYRSFQAKGSVASSTGAATVEIQVSQDGTNYITLGTITLSLTTAESSDGFAAANSWEHYRANLTSITGSTATVTVYMKG
jgi:hypothetical protein